MERIKQALEKARVERQKAGSAVLSPRSVVSETSPIAYTQTQTVAISNQLLQERRIIASSSNDVVTEAYKILRTQVLQRMRDNNWNSLAVTSTTLNEGKTLTAINLGISLAMEVESTVLLVDIDLRRPSVHSYFGMQPKHGLSDYLMDDVPLENILLHPEGIPRFVILPGSNPIHNSSEMLNSPKMVNLVEELKSRYPSRIVLFDLPPLLSTADALAFSPYVDAVLLVIEEGGAQTEDIKRAASLLQGVDLIGTVLNKSRSISLKTGGKSEGIKLLDWLRGHSLAFLSIKRFKHKIGSWLSRKKGSK